MITSTTQTQSRRHADLPRAIDALPSSPEIAGRFGRLFRELPVHAHAEATLSLLALTMIGKVEPDKDLGEPDEDENPDIPAGYTYLGQFIDHDITFDPASSLQRQNDPNGVLNFRTPRFDLDSVYGRGPADQPYLYASESTLSVSGGRLTIPAGLKFLLGPGGADLPRNAVGRALIGDPRNDENLIISQLHRTFLQFHNAVVDRLLRDLADERSVPVVQKDLRDGALPGNLFTEAQRLVRWHYQWLVVHDFLPRVCGQDVVDHIMADGGDNSTDLPQQPRLMFYPLDTQPFIPVEFSVAAYRFGHSMVRPSYFLSDELRDERVRRGNRHLRLPILGTARSLELDNLAGFRPLPPRGRIEWKYFFDGLGEVDDTFRPQPSYKIDVSLAHPLGRLPLEIAATSPASLAERNLRRGLSMGLPSGQRVARRMGLEPLSDTQLEVTEDLLRERLRAVGYEPDPDNDRIRDATNDLADEAPLWYYILKEAEVHAEGKRLGKVGGRIVAEVLIGLLAADPLSYLRIEPRWRPTLSDDSTTFDMRALIQCATT